MDNPHSCKITKKCGGCSYQGISYEEQLTKKQKTVKQLLLPFAKPDKIIGMDNPYFYRNKVHHAFARDRKGNIISGCYAANSHRVVMVEECMLEDRKSQEIIRTIRKLIPSFKLLIYNEDIHRGLIRHVLIRRGFSTGEILVVIVAASPVFPSKNNFVKALLKEHPEITSIVLNINDADTSMVLGERNIVLYGPGFIKDTLAGNTFRISPNSFYQVNPMQTEKLYELAVSYAGLTGKESVIDAYCGIGTIGLTAAKKAGRVIGIELNPDAVKDAVMNAKESGVKNVSFYKGDASDFLNRWASAGEHADVIFMDPPRSGSTVKFMNAAVKMKPSRIVYVSCNPETLSRDLRYLTGNGYKAEKISPVDMFPWTGHVETVCLLSRK